MLVGMEESLHETWYKMCNVCDLFVGSVRTERI